MSEVKVNKISPRTNCGTVTLGDSGDSFVIPAGATITNNGTQTGFGRTGTVDWNTTAVTSSPLSAVSGTGYFINTTSGAITVNLPAGSAGDIVSLADYAATWQTNNVTVTPNGTDKIGGVNTSVTLNTEGQSVTFVYTDSTQGWINTMDSTSNVRGSPYIVATGGTITTCGNYKIHTFTGPGTFTVSATAACAADNNVDYLVVAGGASGGVGDIGGGGGAGGFRLSNDTCMPAPQTSPLANTCGVTVTATSYPITVGGGGASVCGSPTCRSVGNNGSNSTFSTITSTGGGGGGGGGAPCAPSNPGQPGGSGGGAMYATDAGLGNTPPVSPPQGNNGGDDSTSSPAYGAGGGGGAGAVGGNGSSSAGGAGGAGSYVVGAGFAGCNGTPGPVCGARYFAGGGGGAVDGNASSIPGAAGGVGGGGRGYGTAPGNSAVPGTVNTGGGGGGAEAGVLPAVSTGAGGSGIVIIRYKYQ